ncbi:RNA methyltransferase [Ignatzschineria larvae DSM 13226]|uniref:RNA methyltransferase n=1 Tax=Ignatzschineria larvae DSM 13226 TaxID=1111732 RepID=A0ABZ3C1Y7_9GAMM|nr:RNA methyltransferase [Ignatzschineria larvae]
MKKMGQKIIKREISSVTNDRMKHLKKLGQKRYRDQSGLFLIEGFHLVEEAIKHRAMITTIIYATDLSTENRASLEAMVTAIEVSAETDELESTLELLEVTPSILQSLSQTMTPQGIMAVIAKAPLLMADFLHQLSSSASSAKTRALPHLLLLDQVQDPGNVGTMIRTAEAAGFAGVILGEGTADLYNDKTIRATQGALFQLPILTASLPELLPKLHQIGYCSWVTTLEEASFYSELTQPSKVAIVMGNEGNGVDLQLQAMASERVKIPMLGEAESLNVAIAAAILTYQFVR